jgi:hypothetical protein
VTELLTRGRNDLERHLARAREELRRLEVAAAALGVDNGARATGRRAPSRRAARAARGRQPRGRAAQAEALIAKHPGLTTAQLAARMKMNPKYLYKLLPQMQKDTTIHKDGKGWAPGAPGAKRSVRKGRGQVAAKKT